MSGAPPAVPSWERDWPGRFGAELSALQAAGTRFRIDQDRLAGGALHLELDWIGPSRPLRLRAAYPAAFPWTRPQVYLDASNGEPPRRHCSPMDGEICLLGRDTRQWNPLWTLQELLDRQLEAALSGCGDEDPQAEPAEVWWNSLADDSAGFCIVDSAWNPRDVDGGTLTVRFGFDHAGAKPVMRACVVAVASGCGTFSASLEAPLGGLGRTLRAPWVHVGHTLVPESDPAKRGSEVTSMMRDHPRLQRPRPHAFDGRHEGHLVAFSYPMEVAHGSDGTGWLFVVKHGRHLVPTHQRQRGLGVLQTLRAGPSDLRARNPGTGALAGRRIVLAGLGAIGAPIAMELARSGCTQLDVVDHDRVEPGNSVRWIAGPPAWGLSKVAAVEAEIADNHPACRVRAYRIMLGVPSPDDAAVEALVAGADLVIDATVAYAPGMWLGARCQGAGVPLLAVMAWARSEIEGGMVAFHAPSGGCPRCLEHAGFVPPPPAEDAGLQPPGCAERTFQGAGHDLRELSLQTVRMAARALEGARTSVVALLAFETGAAGMRLPRWTMREFPPSDGCGCARRRG